MATSPDYYDVFQISPNADGEVIQTAYKRLVEKWHAERRPGDPTAFGRLSLLDEAYAALSDPQKRQEYDRQRGQPAACSAVIAEPSLTTAERQQGRSSAPPAGSSKTEGKTPPPAAEMQRDVVSATWGSGPYSRQQPASDAEWGYSREAKRPGESLQAGDADRTKGVVSTAVWVIFTVGAILFGVAHGKELFARPGDFLFRCLVWGLFFGIPASLCLWRKKRAGITSVATLFFLAAGVDVVGPFIARTFLQPSTEEAPARVEVPQPLTSGDRNSDPIGDSEKANRKIREDVALACVESGRALTEIKEYNKAIKAYDEAIRLKPGYVYAIANRGCAWTLKGDYDKAIRDFDEVIRINPSHGFYSGRAQAWLLKGDHDKAIRDYNEAIRIGPSDPNIFALRGNAWLLKGDCDKAVRDFDEALRLDPNNSYARERRKLTLEVDRAVRLAERQADRQSRNQRRAKVTLSAIEELDPKFRIFSYKDDWRRFTNPYRVNKISTEWERDAFVEFLVKMEMNEHAERQSIARYASEQGLSPEEWRRRNNYPMPEDHKSGAWKRLRDNLTALEYR